MNTYSATPMQRSFWFLDQLDSGSSSPIIRFSLELDRSFTVEKLESAFQALVQENPSLSQSFTSFEDSVLAFDRPPVVPGALVLSCEDSNTITSAQQAFITETSRIRASDFPLLRFRILSKPDGRQILLFAFHHIIFDGPSIPLLAQRLLSLLAEGKPGPAAVTASQAAQKVNELALDCSGRDKAFWRDYLSDRTLKRLEFDGFDSSRGQAMRMDFTPEEATRFAALVQLWSVTPFTGFLTLYSLAFSLLSGAEDFLVLTPVSVRKTRELRTFVGCLINTIPIRIEIRVGDSSADHANRIFDLATAAFRHSSYPFQKIVEAVSPERLPGRNPLSDIVVSYQKDPYIEFTAGEIRGKIRAFPEPPGDFVLIIDGIENADDAISVQFQYQPDVLTANDISRLQDLVRLLLMGSGAELICDLKLQVQPTALHAQSASTQSSAPRAPTVLSRPETALEMYLHSLWQELLPGAEFGTDSNFFDIGGTSLKAMQLLSHLKQKGYSIYLLELFRKSTIRSLALALAGDKPVNLQPAPVNELSLEELSILNKFNTEKPFLPTGEDM